MTSGFPLERVRVLAVGDQPAAHEAASLLALLGATAQWVASTPAALGLPALGWPAARAQRWDVVLSGHLRPPAEPGPPLDARVTVEILADCEAHDASTWERTLACQSGLAALSGSEDGPPLIPPPGVMTCLVGAHAALAALAGLLSAERRGTQEKIVVSARRAAMAAISPTLAAAAASGQPVPRPGNRMSGLTPGSVLPCRDGFIGLGVANDADWQALTRLVDDPDLADPRFATAAGRRAHRPLLEHHLQAWLQRHTRDELFHLGQSWRLPFARALDPAEVERDPHVRHLSRLPPEGSHSTLVSPWLFRPLAPTPFPRLAPYAAQSMCPPQARDAIPPPFLPPAPQADPSLCEPLAPDAAAVARGDWRAADEPGQPLRGTRIVELGSLWSAPYAARLLADLGADVLKVEAPHRPDGTRGATTVADDQRHLYPRGEPGSDPLNRCATFNDLNRGKTGAILDLTTRAGHAHLLSLLATTDILIENFTPRVLPNLDLGPTVLAAANPGLVWVSMPAFGSRGPYVHYVAVGGGLELLSGLAHASGHEYLDGVPHLLGAPVTDCLAGAYAALGALAALRRRAADSVGSHVELIQLVAGLRMARHSTAPPPANPLPSSHPAATSLDDMRLAGHEAAAPAVARSLAPQAAPGPASATPPSSLDCPTPLELVCDRLLDSDFFDLCHPSAGSAKHLRPPWHFVAGPPVASTRPAPCFAQTPPPARTAT